MKKQIAVLCTVLLWVCAVFAPMARAAGPALSATEAYCIIDADTGLVLAQQNMDEELHPASITKVMTLGLACEKAQGQWEDVKLTVSHEDVYSLAGTDSSHIALQEGEAVPLTDALYATMMASANDGANLLAEYFGGGTIADGVAVKTSFSRTDCNVFVITKDNEACCFTEEEYALHKDIVREAVCGRSTLLLKNGEQLDQSGNTMPVANMEPRTAIGVSQDGKEVYLMVVDGRNFYYSNGADLLDLMNLMSACGASDALNLDGGGSSTFIARDGAEGELKLLNWPTDQGGVMRKVATGLAIVEQ